MELTLFSEISVKQLLSLLTLAVPNRQGDCLLYGYHLARNLAQALLR